MSSMGWWAAASAVVIAACSSFGTSEPTPPATADGGDASSGNSSSGTASTPDGGVSDGTAAAGFCATRGAGSTYCADFDDGALPPAGGWSLLTTGGGTVTLATTGARSGTHSMTSAVSAGMNGAAALRRPIGSKPVAITLAAGVRIDNVAGGSVDVAVIEMKSALYRYYALEVAVQGDGTATLEEHRFSTAQPDYDIANSWPLIEKVPVGKWFELALVLTMTGGTSTALVQVDGKTVATGAPAAHQMDELTNILFGDQGVKDNVSWNIGFDDLRITVTP